MDRLVLIRQIGDVKVNVTAEYIDHLELYGTMTRLNGKLFDVRLTDNPWEILNSLVEQAFTEAADGAGDELLQHARLG